MQARQDPQKGWVDNQGKPLPIKDPNARKIMRSFYEKEHGITGLTDKQIDAALAGISVGAAVLGFVPGPVGLVARGVGFGVDAVSAYRQNDISQMAPSVVGLFSGKYGNMSGFAGTIFNNIR